MRSPGRNVWRIGDSGGAAPARMLQLRRHRQPLAALGAAALQDEAPVLGGHAHEEPVGTRAATTIRLIGPLHDVCPTGRPRVVAAVESGGGRASAANSRW